MATAIPAGGRILGQLIRGAINIEKIRKAVGAIPRESTEETDCAQESDETQCNLCLLKEGILLPSKPRRSIRAQNIVNWVYQLYIANLKASPERFEFCDKDSGLPVTNFKMSPIGKLLSKVKGEPVASYDQLNLTEWFYNKIWFDGFWRDLCTVVDAKGKYQQFLDEGNLPNEGFPEMVIFPKFLTEAAGQLEALASALPKAKLQWHFMEHRTYLYAKTILPSPITSHHTRLPPIEA